MSAHNNIFDIPFWILERLRPKFSGTFMDKTSKREAGRKKNRIVRSHRNQHQPIIGTDICSDPLTDGFDIFLTRTRYSVVDSNRIVARIKKNNLHGYDKRTQRTNKNVPQAE